jgi:uncharacterized DUF497 family protein
VVRGPRIQRGRARRCVQGEAEIQGVYNRSKTVFEWDRYNSRKIRAHGINREEVEEALSTAPIPIYEQVVEGEVRFVYYGETTTGRLLAMIVTERGEKLRVITAYELDAGQKRDYLGRRARGE